MLKIGLSGHAWAEYGALGEELARRGHAVHLIGRAHPPSDAGVTHHPVGSELPEDYTVPLAVKLAQVCHTHQLDILHVHRALPDAVAANLARSLGAGARLVTTLHGSDATVLGQDCHYGPAIAYALAGSDAVTAVSHWLHSQTSRMAGTAIEVIPNFFVPRPPDQSRWEVRGRLGLAREEALILHASDLGPAQRIPLLLEVVARLKSSYRLVLLAGGDFNSYEPMVDSLGLRERVTVRQDVTCAEDFVQVADVGLFTPEAESFGLSILALMSLGRPSVATRVGALPELVEDQVTGLLVPSADPAALAAAVDGLLAHPQRRAAMGRAAQMRARAQFSPEAVVPRYEALYQRLLVR